MNSNENVIDIFHILFRTISYNEIQSINLLFLFVSEMGWIVRTFLFLRFCFCHGSLFYYIFANCFCLFNFIILPTDFYILFIVSLCHVFFSCRWVSSLHSTKIGFNYHWMHGEECVRTICINELLWLLFYLCKYSLLQQIMNEMEQLHFSSLFFSFANSCFRYKYFLLFYWLLFN